MPIVLLDWHRPHHVLENVLREWHRERDWRDGQLVKSGWIWLATALRLCRVLFAAGLWPIHFLLEPVWDDDIDRTYDGYRKIVYTNMSNVAFTAFTHICSLTFLSDPGFGSDVWAFPFGNDADLLWHLQHGPRLLRLGGGQLFIGGKKKTWFQLNLRATARTITVLLPLGLLVWRLPFVVLYVYACVTLLFAVLVNSFNH
jgi:hypothetical protein